jgi:hypothetical protein
MRSTPVSRAVARIYVAGSPVAVASEIADGLAMEQYPRWLDEVVCEINRWRLAIAIGLALLDLTVICALHATDVAKFVRDGVAERGWGTSTWLNYVPNWLCHVVGGRHRSRARGVDYAVTPAAQRHTMMASLRRRRRVLALTRCRQRLKVL